MDVGEASERLTSLFYPTVENVGDGVGTQSIELADVDGSVVDETSVTLAAGESTSVEVGWETGASDVGTGTVTVASRDDVATAAVEIVDSAGWDLPGDVDGDGQVTSLDATLTQRYITGLDPPGVDVDCADLTGDGAVTPADVTAIHQAIVGIDRS